MRNAYLTVKFVRDSNDDDSPGLIVTQSYHEDRLRKEYDHPGIVVTGIRRVSDTRYYVTATVSFTTKAGEAPVSALVRERNWLVSRTVMFDHAKGDFIIEKLTIDGNDYDPETVLFGYREDAETTLERVNTSIDSHPNAENVADWLRHLVKTEGLTTGGLITRIRSVLSNASHAFQTGGEEAFHEHLKSKVPALAERVDADVPPRAVWNHLITASGVLEHLNESHLASDTSNPEEILKRLYAKFSTVGEATISTSRLQELLSKFSASSEAGQMFRFGLFVAAQLGMETVAGRKGAASLSDLHEQIAVTFDDAAHDMKLY